MLAMRDAGMKLEKFKPKVVHFLKRIVFVHNLVRLCPSLSLSSLLISLSVAFHETDPLTGDGLADNDCRYKTVDGEWTNVTGTLYNEDLNQPGRWLEKIYGSPVNYTVIAISDDYSVEYDCGTSSTGITNYCIHVLSRTPTLDQSTFDKLIKMAEEMGLNPQGLPVTMTLQEGC
jgi:hypothetical protein